MLEAFLREQAVVRERPSACLFMVADWIKRARGVDPAAPYRGRAPSSVEAEQLVRELGGIRKAMQDGARRAGLAETEEPEDGDVALIFTGYLHLPAIRSRGRWVVQLKRGIAFVRDAEVVQAWSIR